MAPLQIANFLGVALRHLLSLGSTFSCSFYVFVVRHHEKQQTSGISPFSNSENTSAPSGVQNFQPATVLLKTRLHNISMVFPRETHQGPSGSSSSHSLHRRLGKGVLCIFDKGGDLQKLQNPKAISPWEIPLRSFFQLQELYEEKKHLYTFHEKWLVLFLGGDYCFNGLLKNFLYTVPTQPGFFLIAHI